jgi:hypothetical protein
MHHHIEVQLNQMYQMVSEHVVKKAKYTKNKLNSLKLKYLITKFLLFKIKITSNN